MIKNKKVLLVAMVIFFTVEAVLGVLIQKAGGEYIPIFCFTSVVLACLFCTSFAEKSVSYLLVQLALICTVCADFFLLMTPVRRQLPAMIFFSVTQLSYFLLIYLHDDKKFRRAWHVAVRAVLSVFAVILTLAVLGDSADAVAVVSMFYYANLITNVVFAFIDFKKLPILAIGLLLFALCDALIGLNFLRDYVTVPDGSFIYKLIHPGFDLAWAFYLPSQALLSVSLFPFKARRS
jgi:hypothetical protein